MSKAGAKAKKRCVCAVAWKGGAGRPNRARAVAPRWCSAWPSAPWRGAALGCAGAAKACGFAPMGALRPGGLGRRSD